MDPRRQPSYTLDELLARCNPRARRAKESREWLEANPVGGEFWLVGLDPTEGQAFNRVTKVPVVVPITSGGDFARTAGFAVALTGAGTRTTGVVRCDQPRALDIGARSGRKLESVPAGIVDEVLAKLNADI